MNILVFGGRSPISVGLCKKLANSGHQVHLASRKIDSELKEIFKDIRAFPIYEIDLANTDLAIKLTLKIDQDVKGLDGLVFLHRYRGVDSNLIEQYIVEVLTPFQILETLSKVVRVSELAVVLTSSPAATKVVPDQDFQYHASKAATEQLIRFASVRFAKNMIRTNGINPGSFVYKERAANFYKSNPQILIDAESSIPLGRMATVDDVAEVAYFLLSKKSSYINGEIINLHGGKSNL
jgi:3-oxoacyl-[acyl-carrier protein] reductase